MFSANPVSVYFHERRFYLLAQPPQAMRLTELSGATALRSSINPQTAAAIVVAALAKPPVRIVF